MADTIIDYARFLEVRERRQRVATAGTRLAPGIAGPGTIDPGHPGIIDGALSIDRTCGTERVEEVGQAETGVELERAVAVARPPVRPGSSRDRDAR